MGFHPNQARRPHDSTMTADRLSALAPQAAASPANSNRAAAPRTDARWPTRIGKLYALLGASGSVTLVVGAVLAVACTAWAIRLDVPFQVALLTGYITAAATACICAALVAVRHSTSKPAARPSLVKAGPRPAPVARTELTKADAVKADAAGADAIKTDVVKVEAVATDADQSDMRKPDAVATEAVDTESVKTDTAATDAAKADAAAVDAAKVDAATAEAADAEPVPAAVARKSEPDYAAWKQVDPLRVADASRLWCAIEPGRPASPDVMDRARAILDALESGELEKSESAGVLAQYKMGWHTEVHREALKAWAAAKGDTPRFLCD